MIDIETLKVAALVVLIAVLATILRRRVGLLAVVWAIAIGIFVAGRIAKMAAQRSLRETMIRTAVMRDELNWKMQTEMMRELVEPSINDLAIQEAIEDEIRSDD